MQPVLVENPEDSVSHDVAHKVKDNSHMTMPLLEERREKKLCFTISGSFKDNHSAIS